jgi:outer membrane protein assembly complex protein YaeT
MNGQMGIGGKRRVAFALLVSLVLALLVTSAPAPARAAEAEPSGEKIVRIVLRGNVRVTAHRILGQMRLRDGSLYSPAAVDEDLKRIYTLGEFDNVVVRPEKTAEGLVLVVELTERPALSKLEFEGNRKFSRKDLEEVVGVKPGALIDRHKIFAAVAGIERKYHEAGYHFVSVVLDEKALESNHAALYTITEGPEVRVKKLEFSGDASIPAAELDKQVTTRPYFWIFSPGTFDEEQLDRDLGALRNYYIEQGFLDVKADRELIFTPDKASLTIRFIVDEGPRYKVRSLSLQGVKRFAPSLLEKQMELAAGQAYTSDRVKHDMELLRDTYGEVGFIDTTIKPVVDFTDQPGTVDVTIKVEEGKAVRIGEIRVEGNRLTQGKVIRRELRFFPEETVNTKLIDSARRRLEGIGIFKPGSIQVTTMPTKTPDVVDVLVRVEDTETTNLILGAGISSNSGILGNISLVQRNFDLTDWPKSAQDFWRGESFRGAGQLFQIVLEPGTEMQRYRIDFRDPHVADTDFGLSTSLFLFERNRDTYNEGRAGVNVGVSREIAETLTAFMNFRVEGINISSIDAGVPKDVTDVKGTSMLTSVEVGVTKDTTDSLLFPSEGYRLTGSVEQAGALGGDYAFTRLTVDAKKYFTITRDVLDRRSVLMLHGRVGEILSDAPIFERFYAGGQGTIRGFRYRGVGPRFGKTELGGDFMALASAEYSFPIYEKTLNGVFFLDTGTVEPTASLSAWRASVGFGVRFTVPFLGPVPFALDFGIPIAKQPGDRTEIFSFSIGTSF